MKIISLPIYMSSIFDANIDKTVVVNRRTATLSIDLAVSPTKIFDLTQTNLGGIDFQPDAFFLKYIAFSSQNAVATNRLPILVCDFIDGDILAPYLARTSIQSFNVFHKAIFESDIRHVTITSKYIQGEEGDGAYPEGTVLISLEFIRYKRHMC
jgi:hypothetical protein